MIDLFNLLILDSITQWDFLSINYAENKEAVALMISPCLLDKGLIIICAAPLLVNDVYHVKS